MQTIEENISNSLCHACLCALTDDELADSTHDIFETPDLAEKLSDCCSVPVEPLDGFPKHLCSCCFRKVNEFHQFRTMCVESAKRFREMQKSQRKLNEPQTVEGGKPDIELRVQPSTTTPPSRRKRGRPPKLKFKSQPEEQVASNSVNQRKDPIRSLPEVLSVATDDTNSFRDDKLPKGLSFPGKPLKSSVLQCDICPERFFVQHRLTAHKRKHKGLVPYPCPHEGCERAFNRWHYLSEHLKNHEGTSHSYKCEERDCGRVYKHKATLIMHKRKFHKLGPELKSHVCEICGKVFKSSAILNDHRYTHKDKSELPYVCPEPQCMRRFSNKEKLKVHTMRHAGIKNFSCPHCGMRKTTRNELKIHINYHTLERTWPCRFCSKVCNSSSNLKMHVRTMHERARDYACRFCERSFAKPDTRKYHEMTHTGEKPHECPECGKRFTQPAALRTHKKIHLRLRAQLAANGDRATPPPARGGGEDRIVQNSTESEVRAGKATLCDVTSSLLVLPQPQAFEQVDTNATNLPQLLDTNEEHHKTSLL